MLNPVSGGTTEGSSVVGGSVDGGMVGGRVGSGGGIPSLIYFKQSD